MYTLKANSEPEGQNLLAITILLNQFLDFSLTLPKLKILKIIDIESLKVKGKLQHVPAIVIVR